MGTRFGVVVSVVVATLALTTTGIAQARPVIGNSWSVVPTVAAPQPVSQAAAVAYAAAHPQAAPPGSNDFRCRPEAARPRPIVLLHGSDSSAYSDFGLISPMLRRQGFCVFAVNYGGLPRAPHGGAPTTTGFGTEDMRRSGIQVAAFIDRVLAATGAPEVDIVGYSQGATIGRYVIARLGKASVVGRWVGLASPTYGSTFYGLAPLSRIPPLVSAVGRDLVSPALVQQAAGSDFMTRLNRGGDTVPGVAYTTIGSRFDEVIRPPENARLRSPGARNIVISDRCPTDLVGHFAMPYDPVARQLLLAVLDPTRAPRVRCRAVPLGFGIADVILGAHAP